MNPTKLIPSLSMKLGTTIGDVFEYLPLPCECYQSRLIWNATDAWNASQIEQAPATVAYETCRKADWNKSCSHRSLSQHLYGTFAHHHQAQRAKAVLGSKQNQTETPRREWQPEYRLAIWNLWEPKTISNMLRLVSGVNGAMPSK